MILITMPAGARELLEAPAVWLAIYLGTAIARWLIWLIRMWPK